MRYKYEEDINSIPSCPPRACRQRNVTGYRIVFEDVNRPENFLPVLKREPRRLNFMSTDALRCSGYALSFFASFEQAQAKFQEIDSNHPNWAAKNGDCIAEGEITSNDGLVSEPNGTGHFDLHEFEGTNVSQRFRVVSSAR